MSDQLSKAALRELAECKKKEFGRALTPIWPLELGGMAQSAARAKSISELENTGRAFIAEAVDLTKPSERVSETFALVDDEVTWLMSKLEERIIEYDLRASRGLISGQALRSEFQAVRARLTERVRQSQMQLNVSKQADLPAETRGRKPKHDWTAATNQVWGLLYRGKLNPETQSEVESALADALSVDGAGPELSNVRPLARKIWKEYQRNN